MMSPAQLSSKMLRKNDVIAVLADLQDETLRIWVNGKRVLKVFIDGCVRLGLTTWNGSVFEIVDDIDVEDLLQVETTSESDPMQAVVDPESDYSDADSDEDEIHIRPPQPITPPAGQTMAPRLWKHVSSATAGCTRLSRGPVPLHLPVAPTSMHRVLVPSH